MAVAGDRAQLAADGTVVLHGRDSVTINSGGEKVFAEEVERALMHHPAIADVVVCGRPSERWGSEVCAVLAFHDGQDPGDDELLAEAGTHIARAFRKAGYRGSDIGKIGPDRNLDRIGQGPASIERTGVGEEQGRRQEIARMV